MSDSQQEVRRLGVETTGIEIIEESERTAQPRDLFWPWFAANVSVFGISYAAFVLGFGISFWQSVVVVVVGVVVSFALCGLIALAGKRGSAPTMIPSRAAFGVTGQKVPGVISWLTSIGWETFLTINATLATATVMHKLGWGGGTATKIIACIIVAALVVLASVAGYHIIMRLQSWLTWITGVITVVFMVVAASHIEWSKVSALPSGSWQQTIGALVMVMTGFGLGWINIAADWSRYQRRDASGGQIVAWNTFGGAIAPVILVIFGLLLAAPTTRSRTASSTTRSARSPTSCPPGSWCPSSSPPSCRSSAARSWASTPRGSRCSRSGCGSRGRRLPSSTA